MCALCTCMCTRYIWPALNEHTYSPLKHSEHHHKCVCMPCPAPPRSNLRVCKLSKQEAEAFYDVHRGKPFYDNLTNFMSSGRICALELVAPGAIGRWRNLIGPTDSNQARQEAPNSLRAHFGTDKMYNACHGSDAPDTAAYEVNFFFGQGPVGKCDVGGNTTLGVIKPHIVLDGAAGLVVDCVQVCGWAWG